MDKVARDPSVIIRGALSKRPAGAGLKTGLDFGDTRGRYLRPGEEGSATNGVWNW